jgi:hypothetical protein
MVRLLSSWYSSKEYFVIIYVKYEKDSNRQIANSYKNRAKVMKNTYKKKRVMLETQLILQQNAYKLMWHPRWRLPCH